MTLCPVGGAIGARTAIKTGNVRHELFTGLLKLPSDQAPHAAQAREMYVLRIAPLDGEELPFLTLFPSLQTKLAHNAYAQELLRDAGLPVYALRIGQT
jgi:hypothetical protein